MVSSLELGWEPHVNLSPTKSTQEIRYMLARVETSDIKKKNALIISRRGELESIETFSREGKEI